jgi:hypothetical protein
MVGHGNASCELQPAARSSLTGLHQILELLHNLKRQLNLHLKLGTLCVVMFAIDGSGEIHTIFNRFALAVVHVPSEFVWTVKMEQTCDAQEVIRKLVH